MKIAMVCPYDYFRPGGVQTHIRELSQNLRNRGHEVKVLAPKCQEHPPEEVHVIFIGKSRCIKFQATQIDVNVAFGQEYRILEEVLQKEKFGLIHYHTIWNPFIPFQVLWKAQLANPSGRHTASVATFHDTPAPSLFGKLASSLLMPAASYLLAKYFLDETIAVSSVPADILKTFYRGDIHIIANGINANKYSQQASHPFSKYQDGKINILFLGRLEQRKGAIYLLRAYANLKKQYEHIRLLVAGDGYLKEDVNSFVQAYQLADVEMLGYIEEKDKPRYYATCDIYCSPALYGESFGIVLVEAMASGKPAVGAANPGYKTVLTGKGQQLLVEPESVSSLEAKLSALIENEHLRRELGAWGQAAAQQYDWAPVTDRIEAVYGEALHHRRNHFSRKQTGVRV